MPRARQQNQIMAKLTTKTETTLIKSVAPVVAISQNSGLENLQS